MYRAPQRPRSFAQVLDARPVAPSDPAPGWYPLESDIGYGSEDGLAGRLCFESDEDREAACRVLDSQRWLSVDGSEEFEFLDRVVGHYICGPWLYESWRSRRA